MTQAHPPPRGTARPPPLLAFGLLFSLATLPRALLISVIPVQALDLFGDAQRVSTFYFAVSLAGVCVSVLVPALARRVQARGVFVIGAGAMLASTLLLGFREPAPFVAGMLLHVFGFTAMEIALTLFIMRLVPRRQFGRFEPMRVLFTAGAYLMGPWLGVFLEGRVWHWLPFALAGVVALAAIAHMRLIGLHAPAHGEAALPGSGNPLRNVRRFVAQPRLRLAWALTFGRAAWWTLYFIYVPIYAVTSGLGEVAGGAVVSAGVAIVLTVPFWGWVGRRYGLRRMVIGSAFATGAAMLVLALVAGNAWLGAALWLVSAALATPLDGAGNIPFLRAVRARERSEMTGVFLTYRDASQLLPPGVFAVLLRFFELPAVFVASGLGMMTVAWLARYLPRRL